MKATEKDVKEWMSSFGMPYPFNIGLFATFHNWMEDRQEIDFLEYITQDADKPKPEPKIAEAICKNGIIGYIIKEGGEWFRCNVHGVKISKAYTSANEALKSLSDDKPEQKMEKPEYYDNYKHSKTEDLAECLKYNQDELLRYSNSVNLHKKYMESIEYILAERANKIEVGDRYSENEQPCNTYKVLGVYESKVWLLFECINGTLITRKSEINKNYTKLPKDGE